MHLICCTLSDHIVFVCHDPWPVFCLEIEMPIACIVTPGYLSADGDQCSLPEFKPAEFPTIAPPIVSK